VIRPGTMRHRATLQQRATGLDAAGGVRNAWEDFATRWASLERTPGSEVWASAQNSGRVPAVFSLRYLAGVTPAMRLVYDGKVYNVLSAVDQEGRKAEIVITAEELVGEVP
jgi:SPP1 family predicted phage head-tail adaptor